jgi:hypothetical protein
VLPSPNSLRTPKYRDHDTSKRHQQSGVGSDLLLLQNKALTSDDLLEPQHTLQSRPESSACLLSLHTRQMLTGSAWVHATTHLIRMPVLRRAVVGEFGGRRLLLVRAKVMLRLACEFRCTEQLVDVLQGQLCCMCTLHP